MLATSSGADTFGGRHDYQRIASLVPVAKLYLKEPYQLQPVREIGIDLLWEISAGRSSPHDPGARSVRQTTNVASGVRFQVKTQAGNPRGRRFADACDLRVFGSAAVRKNPAETAVRKCSEFNARSPGECRML